MFLGMLDGNLIIETHCFQSDWEFIRFFAVATQQFIVRIVRNNDGVVWSPMVFLDQLFTHQLLLGLNLFL
jgi:hypothetical protein